MTRAEQLRVSAVFACLLAGGLHVGSRPATVEAQGTLPTRLIQAGDFTYVGRFELPDARDGAGNDGFDYSNGVLAFNAANNSLFVVGHDWGQQVAEIDIPAVGDVANLRQPFADALDGRLSAINPSDPNSKKIGGLHVMGDRLIVSGYSYYDGSATAKASHFVRSVNLRERSVQGPFRVGALNPGFYAGYFAPIPVAWRSALGGSLLNGQCCLAVVSRTSYGPSVSVVDSTELLAARNPSRAEMLVGYPDGQQPLAAWDSTGLLYNGTTSIRGVLLPEGSSSVLFFGRHGVGKFCYGDPGPCGDPEDQGKGTHAYPYEPRVWAYNVADLAAVRAGRKQPWDVKPYATWRLPGLSGANIGGVALGPASGRIYVSENHAIGSKMAIHVFTLRETVADAGNPAGCTFRFFLGADAVVPGSTVSLPATSAEVALSAYPSSPSCEWEASTASTWVSVKPASGVGPAEITVSAEAHTARQQRSSTVTVAGLTFGVVQRPYVPVGRAAPRTP